MKKEIFDLIHVMSSHLKKPWTIFWCAHILKIKEHVKLPRSDNIIKRLKLSKPAWDQDLLAHTKYLLCLHAKYILYCCLNQYGNHFILKYQLNMELLFDELNFTIIHCSLILILHFIVKYLINWFSFTIKSPQQSYIFLTSIIKYFEMTR